MEVFKGLALAILVFSGALRCQSNQFRPPGARNGSTPWRVILKILSQTSRNQEGWPARPPPLQPARLVREPQVLGPRIAQISSASWCLLRDRGAGSGQSAKSADISCYVVGLADGFDAENVKSWTVRFSARLCTSRGESCGVHANAGGGCKSAILHRERRER
jgi:hypothetical protein